jgi:arylsulfatase
LPTGHVFPLALPGPACAAALIAAGLMMTAAGCRSPAESELRRLQRHLLPRPGANLIVVSFDALRADALGAYGSRRGLSPHLDDFARHSIVFDNAYSVAPVTPTSFAAAFTGLLPTRVFLRWRLRYEDTMARRFADAGYRTAAFVNNIQLTPARSFGTGFEHYAQFDRRPDEEVLERSLRWLDGNRRERFFVWVHFLSPHAPYDYRETAAHVYDDGYDGQFRHTTGPSFDTDDRRELARIRTLYDGEVFAADELFGRLVDELEAAGLLENSIVLATSDHGEEFQEHGGFQHGRLTEEHVRVPLILHHPGARSPLRSAVLVSNVDLLPTLSSLAGIELDVALDGRDLTRIRTPPEWIVGVAMTGASERWLSLRKESFKLILTCLPERRLALYDLAADPGETRDLHRERPDLAAELHRQLGTVLGGPPCAVMNAAVSGEDATAGLSRENVEALAALGYLED